MFIKSIDKNGLGFEIGLQKGDDLLSLNRNPIRDVIDYQFNIVDEHITLRVKRDSEILEIEFENSNSEDLGVVFEEIQYRHCGSKCPFCFVDQNPEGLRQTLYFRDEDFRLSFMHGSYFTLNNVTNADLNRMVTQRLSPLYISVHALDRKTRNFLFGVDRDDKLLEKIGFLTDNKIELHTQIVLCPGLNDKDILQDTIDGLERFYPGVRSVAIVPLGLTKHRKGLFDFQPVDADYSRALIKSTHELQDDFLKKYSERFVYLSDEWYLKAGKNLPSLKHYGDLFQLENGVGMTRQFIEYLKTNKQVFDKPFANRKKLHILTGTLAQPVLAKHLVPVFERAKGLSVTVTGIENDFYGSTIDVSGLLTGGDFIRTIKADNGSADLYLLPPNCLNPDGITIDGISISDIARTTGKRVTQFTGDYAEVRNTLENGNGDF